MATVTISVPDASTASSRMSWLGAPPVPRMSRERRCSPAMTRSSSRSAALDRMEHLHVIVRRQRRVDPLGTEHDAAVARHRDAPCLRAQVHGAQEFDDGGAIAKLARLTVDAHGHATTASPRTNRAGVKGVVSTGGVSPMTNAVIASAVIGASRIPLRK